MGQGLSYASFHRVVGSPPFKDHYGQLIDLDMAVGYLPRSVMISDSRRKRSKLLVTLDIYEGLC